MTQENIMSLLGHLDLPAGDPDLVQLTWADNTTFETVLGASSSVLKDMYSTENLNEKKLVQTCKLMQSALHALPYDPLNSFLPIEKLLNRDLKLHTKFVGLKVNEGDGTKAVENLAQHFVLSYASPFARSHILGHTLQVDKSLGNLSDGNLGEQTGNLKNPMHPNCSYLEGLRFPGAAAVVCNMTQAGKAELEKFYKRTLSMQTALAQISRDLQDTIKMVCSTNSWLQKHFDRALEVLQALSDLEPDDATEPVLTPMARLLTANEDGVFLYAHVVFFKLAFQSLTSYGEQKVLELEHKKDQLAHADINHGNKTMASSFVRLQTYLDLLSIVKQDYTDSGDTNPQRHIDKIVHSWYMLLSGTDNSWSDHLLESFYKPGTRIRNTNTNEIVRKLQEMCAERITTQDERFEALGTKVAAADANPHGQSKGRRPKPKRGPPSRQTKKVATSKSSEGSEEYAFPKEKCTDRNCDVLTFNLFFRPSPRS